MRKVMLIYPPGKIYQRGEDRSQGNVEDSTSTSIRACNDLGYAASMLEVNGYEIFLRDYQSEKQAARDLENDFLSFNPDVLFVSITNATIHNDIQVVRNLKQQKPDLMIILKGSIFFNAEYDMLKQLDLADIDYLIGGESDFIISRLLNSVFKLDADISEVNGILYKLENKWIKTKFDTWDNDLDSLKFPDRSKMNNMLYKRPDTGEPQATITTSRGCAASCIYCLTPKISGTKVRLRSPKNIYMELLECYTKYNIKNFFFKSDTFTMNKAWVKELCEYIINSELHGKIQWVANSRVNPLEKETLELMKKAGCWLVAFGFESGSEETMKKIKKGAKVEDNLLAAKYAKEVGLKIFGFYLIGLPWEDKSHIRDTFNMMFKINADFVEVHIATPYHGTGLYKIAQEENLINETVLGKDYFNAPTIGTKFLNIKEIEDMKKKVLLRYHLRPSYIFNKVLDGFKNPKILINYFKFGVKLIKKNLK